MFSGPKQHSSDRHIMALQNRSRMTWFTMTSPLCFPTSKSLFKQSIPVIGSTRWKSPTKMLLVLPVTNQRINPTIPSLRRVRILPSLNRRTRTHLLARPQAKHLRMTESKKSNPDLLSKLRKDSKLTPQERQCCLNKNLCLFCGVSGHMAKDCPKSTSAVAKSCTALTTPTPESTSTLKPLELKKRLSNPWDYTQPKDCTEHPCAKIVTLGTSTLYKIGRAHV